MSINLWEPTIGESEKQAILNVLDSGVLTRGKEVEKLEEEFAQYVGKKYAVAVSSGSAGLHIVARAEGWRGNDEIITNSFSFVSVGNCVVYEGAKIAFIDSDPQSLCMDPELIEERITQNTKALLVVHMYGIPAHTKQYKAIADTYNLRIFEDASQAHGSPSDRFPVGSISDASVYSLCFNKIITAGEGGIIATDSKELAETYRSLRDQGRVNDPDWINKTVLGFNYRLSEISAAIARAQLSQIETFLNTRKELAELYSSLLSSIPDIEVPHEDPNLDRSWFSYYILLKDKDLRDKTKKELDNNAIGNRTSLPPISDFPQFRNSLQPGDTFPVAKDASERLLTLPLHPRLSPTDIKRVVSVVKKAVNNHT